MKKVSTSQIERLYHFTRQHFVEYYDVQTELVDHLANAIEERWKENPGGDFEKLLKEEFKKFGVFGFMDVVEERQKMMNKRYFKLIWIEVKEFLKLPKVIIFASLIWLISILLIKLPYGVEVITCTFFLTTIVLFILSSRRLVKHKNQVKKDHKKLYLLEELILHAGQVGYIMFIPFQVLSANGLLDSSEPKSFYIYLFLSFIFTCHMLLMYIGYFLLPSKKDKILQKTYPELQLE